MSIEKWIILATLQKLPNNFGNLGKIFVATGFEWLPKVQKITQSGHTHTLTILWQPIFAFRKIRIEHVGLSFFINFRDIVKFAKFRFQKNWLSFFSSKEIFTNKSYKHYSSVFARQKILHYNSLADRKNVFLQNLAFIFYWDPIP